MSSQVFQDFQDYVQQIGADKDKLHEFVHSPASHIVQTEAGPIPSLSGIVAQLSNLSQIVVFEGTELTVSAAHAGKMIWTTSDEPVFITLPEHATDPLEAGLYQGALIQGGEGQVTFLTEGTDELVAHDDLTGTGGKGAPVSFAKILNGVWWLGGQRAAGQVP